MFLENIKKNVKNISTDKKDEVIVDSNFTNISDLVGLKNSSYFEMATLITGINKLELSLWRFKI